MCIAGQRAPMLVESFSLDKLVPQEVPSSSKPTKKSHPHITVQHDYHDHASEAATECQSSADLFRAAGGSPSFPYKLFDMLSRVEAEGHSHIVSWQPHGRAFVVHKPEAFKALLGHYFSVSKLASFQRQLNLYGFIRLTRGADRNGYYHECFLRGKPALLSKIRRMKVKGTGVRARSSPESEPPLWDMPWVSDDSSSSSAQTMPVPSAMISSSECSVVSNDESEHAALDTPADASLSSSSDLVTGWGKQFHYLDLAAPGDYYSQASTTEMLDDQLLNDVDIEKELDDMLLNDDADFDLLARLESLVGDDHDQGPGNFQW